MKISVSWLKELVETGLDGAQLAERLTHAGLEVESVTPFGALSGVVAAEVRGKRPHPKADKLTLVDVFDGREVTEVVCGAPNVPDPGAARSRVLWARPGATLPGGITLQAKEVRGVMSPGMLCADDELGFGAGHAGIVLLGAADGLAPGDDLAKKLGLPDEILEVNVTPNRPDCLGHAGIAREIAALTGARMKTPPPRAAAPADGPRAEVELIDAEGCPRYTALVLSGVVHGPSPLPLRLRLLALGMRPISNIVDATNLALLETGQPLHAFDLDRLAGRRIVVRRAREGERMATLDGQERTLTAEDVAICDAERPVAVAGVMGGASSEVSASTTRVLIESAHFAPTRVRRTAKRLGLHTEASHRFERGVDPAGALDASLRCARLLEELAGARVEGPAVDRYPVPITDRIVTLRAERTRALLGVDVDAAAQARILTSLGLAVTVDGDTLAATVPTRRPDLVREVDLIEEVARVHGYDKVPPRVPTLRAAPATSGDRVSEIARDALRGLGYDEVMTYAFGPPTPPALGLPPGLRIQNPIREELSVMRTGLLPGLLTALQRNIARGVADAKLFEVGEIFRPRAGQVLPEERRRVAGVAAGRSDGWLQAGEPLDVFDLRGVIEELLSALGYTADFIPSHMGFLHPGVQAEVKVDARSVGVMGEIHPDVARALGVEARPFAFELDLQAIGATRLPALVESPRFPAVTRDLSFFVDASIPAKEIRATIERVRDPLCVEIRVLEDYRESGRVPVGKKGMLWSLTYRAVDRTLTDAEVQALHDAFLGRLRGSLQIDLR